VRPVAGVRYAYQGAPMAAQGPIAARPPRAVTNHPLGQNRALKLP
jgi:hypothetical protein